MFRYVSPNSAPSKSDPRDPTMYFIQDDCGLTLQTYLRNRYLDSADGDMHVVPVQAVFQILRDLLSALLYLQRVQVLHRDIKADNCLVTGVHPALNAKLIDFGLAKKFDSRYSNVPAHGPSAVTDMGDEQPAPEADAEVPAPFASATAAGGAAAAGTAAKDRLLNVQSKLFGKPRQYAPEALGLAHLGLEHQYGYESDLWAVGVLHRSTEARSLFA